MRGQKKGKKGQEYALGATLKKQSQRRTANTGAATEKEAHALAYPRREVVVQDNSMRSVTEPGNLAEFLATAELANEEFDSQKANTVVIESNAFVQVRAQPSAEQIAARKEHWSMLQVPRRPKWTRDMDADVLHQMERESFLEWRRRLAAVEEGELLLMTPFEKNLNVWRQLWRVVEMADVLVQIVDARDPELFRCIDLERYVHEVGGDSKSCMLLLNKADLLTENQRLIWAEYYRSIGVPFLFFSAKDAEVDVEAPPSKDADSDSDDEREPAVPVAPAPVPVAQPHDIVRRAQLVAKFAELRATHGKSGDQRIVVGFCGYPNVGKSSTINKLMQEKKVTVSATPGKTKHFQSLFLNEEICLLDCPGLVFPNFVTNKAAMVCSGLLPIDELRDWRSPSSLVCQRIKRSVLEAQYGIVLPKPDMNEYNADPNRAPTADEFMCAYAYVRGFMGVSGAPNAARAARIVLKDYVNGLLRYVEAPPDPQLAQRFDSRQGQEAAIQGKLHRVRSEDANRAPTYVEHKSRPELVAFGDAASFVALEQSRKKDTSKQLRKKKRGGKGKHRGDIEHPYGLPPDMPTYATGK